MFHEHDKEQWTLMDFPLSLSLCWHCALAISLKSGGYQRVHTLLWLDSPHFIPCAWLGEGHIYPSLLSKCCFSSGQSPFRLASLVSTSLCRIAWLCMPSSHIQLPEPPVCRHVTLQIRNHICSLSKPTSGCYGCLRCVMLISHLKTYE